MAKTAKQQINAAHRMGRAEASVKLGEVLTDTQCLQYIKDSISTDFPIDPGVREEMISGHFRGRKVIKALNKLKS